MIADEADTVASRQIASASPSYLPCGFRSAPAIERDPDGCARLLASGDLRGDDFQPARGESGPSSRTRATPRIGRRAEDRPQPKLSERRSRSPWRLCRAFQRARFRRDPRHDATMYASTSSQDPHERQGRGFQILGNYSGSTICIWCPGWSKDGRPSGVSIPNDPGSGPKYFIAAAMVGRQVAISAISATRPTSSMARNTWLIGLPARLTCQHCCGRPGSPRAPVITETKFFAIRACTNYCA